MALNDKTETTEERKEEVKEKLAHEAAKVAANNDVGGIPESPGVLDAQGGLGPVERAEAAVKALEKQSKLAEDILKRVEKIQANALLGGKSVAGSEPTHEDQVTKEARKILKGTGYDEDLFPDKKKATGA